MEGMGERAHGRQRQQRGWHGQPAPSLPGARATPAQPASGGGCLPQPRWAVCATGAGAHQGRPAVRGKRTYGGRPGQRVEEQGTWASRAQKHSEAGYGRPMDRGAWTAKTVKRPRQQPAHPQYANYWAPLTRKRHTIPHSAQSQHTNYWAPRTRKRHQQEHRPQRPTESSNPTQPAKGRTGDCPGPRKGATTRRNVTQGVYQRHHKEHRPQRPSESIDLTLRDEGRTGDCPGQTATRQNVTHGGGGYHPQVLHQIQDLIV